MKVKIGTALDGELLRRARAIASREGKRLNQVIEEALALHLKQNQKASIVARTAGCIRLGKREVDRILREEPGLLDR